MTESVNSPRLSSWEDFLARSREGERERYIFRREGALAERQTAKTKRDPLTSNRRGRDEGRLADSSERCHLPLPPFFFHIVPLFFSCTARPRLRRSSLSFYCSSRRRKTVANRIRGPLFTRSPATLCLCFSPISVAPSLSLSPPLFRLFSFFFSFSLSLSFSSVLPSPLINGNSSQRTILYFLIVTAC